MNINLLIVKRESHLLFIITIETPLSIIYDLINKVLIAL